MALIGAKGHYSASSILSISGMKFERSTMRLFSFATVRAPQISLDEVVFEVEVLYARGQTRSARALGIACEDG